jgi:hypothetical protein
MAEDIENKDAHLGIELHDEIVTGEDSNTESDLSHEAPNDNGEQSRFEIQSLSLHALMSEDEESTSGLPRENSDAWNFQAQTQDTNSNQDEQSSEDMDHVPGALAMGPESVRLHSDRLLKSQNDHIDQLFASLQAGKMGDQIMSQRCYMPDIDSKIRNIFMEEHASLRLAQSPMWTGHTILNCSAYTFDGKSMSMLITLCIG